MGGSEQTWVEMHAGPAEGPQPSHCASCWLLTFGLAPSLMCVWLQHQLSPTPMVQVPAAPGPCTECPTPPSQWDGHSPPQPSSNTGSPGPPRTTDHTWEHGPQPVAFCSSNGPSCPQNPSPRSSQKAEGQANGCRHMPSKSPPADGCPLGGGPACPKRQSAGPCKSVCGGSATVVILSRGMGWSQDQGLEGQKPLPALPGHVQSHEAQAEALTMVSGSPVTRPGPQGGPGGGDIQSKWWAQRPCLPSPGVLTGCSLRHKA